MAGLNLGGPDKNPATPPNPKPETTPEEAPQEVAEESSEPETARFSCHPIMRYSVGEFQFENGLLVIRNSERAAKFREVIKGLPVSEQSRIKELDVSAAEAQVRAILAQNPGATKGIDSSTGDRAPNNQVGGGTLESGGGA